MGNPNKLTNGQVQHDLNGWTPVGAAVYDPTQGNTYLGCVSLPSVGSNISQQFTINTPRTYTLEYAAKGATAGNIDVAITNHDNVPIWEHTEAITDGWVSFTHVVGLPYGTYTLTVTYNDTAAFVDDLSLAWIIMTRLELAQRVYERLGAMASNAGLINPETTTKDFDMAIDAGLRAVQAVWHGRPDVRCLNDGIVDAAIDQIELYMLYKLQRYWSTKTDFTIGPRSESVSQVAAAIDRLIGVAVGGRPAKSGRSVITRNLKHGGW